MTSDDRKSQFLGDNPAVELFPFFSFFVSFSTRNTRMSADISQRRNRFHCEILEWNQRMYTANGPAHSSRWAYRWISYYRWQRAYRVAYLNKLPHKCVILMSTQQREARARVMENAKFIMAVYKRTDFTEPGINAIHLFLIIYGRYEAIYCSLNNTHVHCSRHLSKTKIARRVRQYV